MAQHFWLKGRALALQATCFNVSAPVCDDDKRLALYLRYHATHERAFYKALAELQKLRNKEPKSRLASNGKPNSKPPKHAVPKSTPPKSVPSNAKSMPKT